MIEMQRAFIMIERSQMFKKILSSKVAENFRYAKNKSRLESNSRALQSQA